MYLHAQTQGVQHDQEEHEVLKVAGGDDVPHPVLVRVLRDVAPQGAGLEGVLHTLALETKNRHGLTVCHRTQHYTHAYIYDLCLSHIDILFIDTSSKMTYKSCI